MSLGQGRFSSLQFCLRANGSGHGLPLRPRSQHDRCTSDSCRLAVPPKSAGADLDAPAVKTWHRETPLHWAASNDDVALIDALFDVGANIEREGSSIDGGAPLSSAVGYGTAMDGSAALG